MAPSSSQTEAVDTTNYTKFQTGNPVVRRLIGNFYETVRSIIEPLDAKSVLDAGCGEGESLSRLGSDLPAIQTGIDLNPESVQFASRRVPKADIEVGDITAMPLADASFELVLCLEVLEHLTVPDLALEEISRVSARDIVISVPHEPWFRLGSLARGNYVKSWGNHPEHVNHWNHRSLRSFLEERVDVISLEGSMPWLIAHCRKRA